MKGYVEVVTAKPDKNGKTRYSFKLKNDDSWYSCGLSNPGVKKGDQIEFDFDENGDWKNVVPESVAVLRSAPEVVEARKTFSGFKARDTGKDGYWEAKADRDIETQKRIQLQASRNAAIEVVSIMLQNSAIKLPEKETARHKAIGELISEWTERFQKETNGLGETAVVLGRDTETDTAESDGKAVRANAEEWN